MPVTPTLSRRRFLASLAAAPLPTPAPILLNDSGAWSWFQDERAILDGDTLLAGSVSAARPGNIELATLNLTTRRPSRVLLHEALLEPSGRYDDHNAPALWLRPDSRYLAVYARHGPDPHFFYRISTRPHDPSAWGPVRTFVASPSTRLTYSNLHYLAAEKRLYNFFRGLHNSYKPSYCYSSDWGESWQTGNVFIDVPGPARHRPYVKYASNGRDTIHFLYTEGHPRNYDNSVYHVFYRAGYLHRSDGARIRPLAEGLKDPAEGTLVFRGDPNNVAWVLDLQLDAAGLPYAACSVQKDSANLKDGEAGQDLRYRYARFSPSGWREGEIAYAGARLYPGEDDYPGNIALDPADPDILYLSANADPATGARLPHYELFRGRRSASSWTFTPLTRNSPHDNIRPIVPAGRRRVLLWLQGQYRAYTDYTLAVMALIL